MNLSVVEDSKPSKYDSWYNYHIMRKHVSYRFGDKETSRYICAVEYPVSDDGSVFANMQRMRAEAQLNMISRSLIASGGTQYADHWLNYTGVIQFLDDIEEKGLHLDLETPVIRIISASGDNPRFEFRGRIADTDQYFGFYLLDKNLHCKVVGRLARLKRNARIRLIA